MTGTRRTPIARSRTSPITPVAVKLFDQMRQCRCTCPPRDWHDPKTWIRECEGCERWWELHSHLHTELHCCPWEWPCIEHPSARSPYPRGSEADKRWEPDLEAQELWRQLEAARKAQRKAAREARQRTKAAEQQPPPTT